MRILIDIGHPAHVHLFKHLAWELLKKKHIVFFTCRDKEFEISLLMQYGFMFKSFGKKYKSKIGKALGLIKFDAQEYFTGLKFKPDLVLSHGSMYAAHAAFLLRKPHISMEDTYNSEQVRLYEPFTKAILTSDYNHPLISEKVIKYAGYHELAYLSPNRFTPDKNILKQLGLGENERYMIFRFVSWGATHDIGHRGITYLNKLKAIIEFSKYVKIFISSESDLPKELTKYKINIPAHKIHDAIAFSTLLFGESSTMSEEAAILGIPSIYIYNSGTFYTYHLEKEYELMYNFSESESDQQNAIDLGKKLLTTPNILDVWKPRREKLLFNKIDVTAFMIWFVENWPESFKIMKEDPEYQKRFKLRL